MIKVNNEFYFTIYGKWFDSPGKYKYTISDIVQDSKVIKIDLNDSRFIIMVYNPSNVIENDNDLIIQNADYVELKWIGFNDQIDYNDCKIKYEIKNNSLFIEHIVYNAVRIEQEKFKGDYALHIFK